MLRRVVAAVALVVFASTPVIARTRLFCRYTGQEITDCAEQQVPGRSVVQAEGCCNQHVTRPIGVLVTIQQQEITPPAMDALPVQLPFIVAGLQTLERRGCSPAAPTGPPVLLITRALLI